MKLPMLIGISGYAGSGKDTLADLLAIHHCYRVVHLADGVREALRLLNPIVGYPIPDETYEPTTPTWAETVGADGYPVAKIGPYGDEIRRLQQVMGTEIGREMFGEDVWVDLLFRTITPGELVAIPDMRFPNEFRRIRRANGMVVRISRPGVGPANDHSSETALDGLQHDLVIQNDGEPDAMLNNLLALAAH